MASDAPAEGFRLLTQVPLIRAQIIRAALEDVGIPATIESEEVHSMVPLDFGGISSARVLVPASHLESARELLATIAPPASPVPAYPQREATRIVWMVLLGGYFPPIAIWVIVRAVDWLRRHGASPGRWLVMTGLVLAVTSLSGWMLFFRYC